MLFRSKSLGPTLANFDVRHPYPIDYDDSRTSIGHPVEVGRYPPNAWGLYDMHGNIDEWCSDWFGSNYYQESERDDPTGPLDGQSKCYRGGAWSGQGEDCRAQPGDTQEEPREDDLQGDAGRHQPPVDAAPILREGPGEKNEGRDSGESVKDVHGPRIMSAFLL